MRFCKRPRMRARPMAIAKNRSSSMGLRSRSARKCASDCPNGSISMATLPALSDLVVRRDGVARQMRGRLATAGQGNDLNVSAPDDYHALTGCIECYACLHECPMHARNFDGGLPDEQAVEDRPDPAEGYTSGNPFSLLKLQRIRIDPLTSEAGKSSALDNAIDLGLDACVGCKGCKCGVGIDLMGKVIWPMLEAAGDRLAEKD